MSETAAPVAPVAAPTNGTSAPQKPAPGVTTPTPTPKNGEGAVAAAPKPGEVAATPKPKNPWGDNALKVPLKFKGKEEQVELNSLDDITRMAQRARLADESSRRAKEAERQLAAIIDAAGRDKLAYLKAAGIDPDAFVLERAQEMLRQQEMTAEQRAIESAKAEAQQAKAEAAKIRAEWEQLQQQRALDAQWQEDGPQWEAAMKQRGRIGDKAYAELAANIAHYFTQNGIEATPEQICAEADEHEAKTSGAYIEKTQPERVFKAIAERIDPNEALKTLAPRLTPEMLWGVLQSDDARRQVMALGLAWHKGTKTQTKPPAPQATSRTRDQQGKYLSEAEWRSKRGI